MYVRKGESSARVVLVDASSVVASENHMQKDWQPGTGFAPGMAMPQPGTQVAPG